ncbi:16S rRNA (adenine(1518)-N(6)/adenine(1519)-N(6))-dimethyltransferase RsmA [Liquorilactobacillus capillatus]|uniref:Ribosomal RNA small subunit methyltransferase A n=1 Tax=Liquorilactobacillus capillatus DSM 19910 TaxID=1423731 RepID=A0A0R1M288_9LACO|nr:16S rRNA (adenine(1518)-N(6)/adenine(1519)-N(6))-dimethyltransferase RsmA [Liquorilactobacillus capillatus]KRL01801.1 16S ribosomal RNA methyltransferase KsgA Dim1 family protein [Liquorilactobacillus capillatus DSM 19910]
METYGLNFKKSLGQNFLTDTNILRKIVAAAEVTTADDVIEIGPGIGALTEQLAKKAHRVLALELDERLIPVLAETLAPYPNVQVIRQDVLKANLKKLLTSYFDGQHPVKIVANLPYYITSPIILYLLETGIDFKAIVVMMQKEVAERLGAHPGTKSYGSLTVRVQYQMDVKVPFVVPKTVFVPQPKIDSAIVALTPKVQPWTVLPQNEQLFFKIVRGCFQHRRKNIWNNLQSLLGKKQVNKEKLQQLLSDTGIAPQERAEKLTIPEFIQLTNKMIDYKIIEK